VKKNVHQVTVLGGGSFGTVIANMIAANGYCVKLWLRDQSVAVNIANCGENTTYLPGHKLHKNVVVTTDLKAAVEGCKSLFFAVPSSVFRELAKNLYQWLDADVQIISTAKGI
jgi:glycerol-3-phosphate dehydrogenase (NAD(P)+)